MRNNEWRNGADDSLHHFRHSLFPIRCDIAQGQVGQKEHAIALLDIAQQVGGDKASDDGELDIKP